MTQFVVILTLLKIGNFYFAATIDILYPDKCNVTRYNSIMIKSFKHKGLEKFFYAGSLKGIQPMHAKKLSNILFLLNNLTDLNGLNTPTLKLHPLHGDMEG